MEQGIRFCTTPEGVRIAYATVGKGPPLVLTPSDWTSIDSLQEDGSDTPQEDLSTLRFHGSLAQHNMLVLYDRRGVGLSDRERGDFTVETDVEDLETVVNHLQLDRCALMGSFHLGPAAITFAARHGERVSRLILYGTYADGPNLASDEMKETIIGMMRSHWGLASRTLADLTAPGGTGEGLERSARRQRESATADMVANLVAQGYRTDVMELLPRVAVPTLVLHRRGDRAVPFRMGRELSSLLPNARLVALEGNIHWPWAGDWKSVLTAIADFLAGDAPAPAKEQPSRAAQPGFATILFTDMESSTARRQLLGDAKAQELVHTHNAIVREALKACTGSEIKHTGDGIMASFPSASSALECAVAIQRGVAAHVIDHPEPPLGVYVGLNAGEPIAEESDLFGTSVDLAKRICDHAAPGEILASDVVRQLVAGKGFLFADRGETALRGFEDLVRLYEVRWRE